METVTFSLSAFTTVTTLLNHLFDVSAIDYKDSAKRNAKHFAYEGFNATEILKAFLIVFKGNTDDSEALQDLCDIVNIGLTRGNIRADQLEKTSKQGRDRINDLQTKYHIAMRTKKGEKLTLGISTLTFTRAISVFPYIASQLLASKCCIPDNNDCKFGSDELPVEFKHSGFASLIPDVNDYCLVLFQCYVAYMISFGRKINPNVKETDKQWYDKQKQFSSAAWTNKSVYNNEMRIKAFKNLGLDSHSKYGAVYLKVANKLRTAIGLELITEEILKGYIKEGKVAFE